ncbi:hypothetical protein HG535_0B04020 [Zygotorulaspora mrakii]|uniref:DNA polymerase n=1 Tax=Zygotorulaspora mrakii TaxID=42260 RepID=A0A7H9B0Q0_ZYGMR|nr:uncharacterized protein HG535_0B04020 [Zygotorulaspora mrakii]QLG71362.1 hypothetical protein HG535_0B04020 [Zygotorulaspora mrakii]
MLLFKGTKFVILPNRNASSLKFLAELLVKEGGMLVNEEKEIDCDTIVLINDSFITNTNTIMKNELFFKEFDLDPSTVWNNVNTYKLKCVRATCISEWLRKSSFQINPELVLSVEDNLEDNSEDHSGVKFVTHSATPLYNYDLITAKLLKNSEKAARQIPEVYSSSQNKSENSELAGKSMETEVSNKMGEEVKRTVDISQTTSVPKGNEKLIQALGRLAKRYEMKGDQFRARGYKLARIGIEQYPFKIESGAQAQEEISNVGASIAKKIQTLLDNGSLPGLQELFESEKRVDYFTRCHDIGIYTAKKWEIMGLKSFSEACTIFPEDFTRDWPILFGWSYYEDWLKPIRRDECEKLASVVQQELHLIDPQMKVEILGSYHRGAEKCGDIDLFFYKAGCDDISEIGRIMEDLSISLYRKGYVQCFLQLTRKIYKAFNKIIINRLEKCHLKTTPTLQYTARDDNPRKFMLGVKLPDKEKRQFESITFVDNYKLKPEDMFMSLNSDRSPCRRMDFFCCKYSELGAARLQWIGPKEFNRWIRLKAMHNGLKLTQHGLYDNHNVLLESFDEQRIFQLLNEDYISPSERNHVVKKRRKV